MNADHLIELAEIIETSPVPFSYNLDACFIGQYQRKFNGNADSDEVRIWLGLSNFESDLLFFGGTRATPNHRYTTSTFWYDSPDATKARPVSNLEAGTYLRVVALGIVPIEHYPSQET